MTTTVIPWRRAFVWSSRDVLDGLIEWQTQSDPAGRFLSVRCADDRQARLEVLNGHFSRLAQSIERPETADVTITLRPQ